MRGHTQESGTLKYLQQTMSMTSTVPGCFNDHVKVPAIRSRSMSGTIAGVLMSLLIDTTSVVRLKW